MKKRIAIIGPYKTNVGGVSIHLLRLTEMLKEFYDFDYIDESRNRTEGVFNFRTLNLVKYLSKVLKADVVHIHSGVTLLRIFHIIICRILLRKHVVVTVHRDLNIEKQKNLTRMLLRCCNRVILVNEVSYQFVKGNQHGEKLMLLPAFLPPAKNEFKQLPLPLQVWIDNVRNSTEHSKIIASNAGQLAMHQGMDLYGLDMCIDAISQLNSETGKQQYYLIFVLASSLKNPELLQSYKERLASDTQLSEHVMIWEGGVSFVNLVEQSDLVVRPTNTDGDALTIREALWCGRSVLASDVVTRPEGTEVFKTRSLSSFVEKIKVLTNNKTVKNITSSSCATQDFVQIYRKLYDE